MRRAGKAALALALAGSSCAALAAAGEPGANRRPFPPADDPARAAASGAEATPGSRELEQAIRYLDAGEAAGNDDERRRNYELSAQYAERAVNLMPQSAEAHFVLFGAKGRIAQMGGLATAALALSSLNRELDRVLRLDPNHSAALAARGGMLMKLPRLMGGNTTEGVRYLERASELDPGGAGTRLELAEAYQIVGRDADALRAARQAVELAEKKGEAKKAERARALVSELARACSGCALAATGD